MKNGISKTNKLIFSFIFFLFFSSTLFAQSSPGGASNIFLVTLVILAVVILVGVIMQVADNLLRVEARRQGADANYALFPGFRSLFRSKPSTVAQNEEVIFLNEGHDILLEGEAVKGIDESVAVSHFALQPTNFIGISPIPKLAVAIGDTIQAGDEIFFDKKRPEIKYVAPVSGEIIAINRAEKRAISEIVILADKEQRYRQFPSFDLEKKNRSELVAYLLGSGTWPMIRQRPFNVVADPEAIPKAIFISTFDTAPLAPDLNMAVAGREAAFTKGLEVLNKLCPGNVHLGLNAKTDNPPAAVFMEAQGVEKHWFHGRHPAGNVGVQIHHIDPISPQDIVWTLGVQELISIGNLFLEGRFDAERVVALTGSELTTPKYVRTHLGANLESLVSGNIAEGNLRFVSGDVLSGERKEAASFLNFFDDQLTVLVEGDYYEAFGWLAPLKPRPSLSSTFLSKHLPGLRYKADTNTHGEKRAFVMTGQYERLLPMDIYLQHLMKSIIINDFERMEGLGLAELVEEDVALAEFACTSKQPLQKILREGLDVMREQG